MKFETKDGLGLGDKESRIKKLYPKAKNLGAGAYSLLDKVSRGCFSQPLTATSFRS